MRAPFVALCMLAWPGLAQEPAAPVEPPGTDVPLVSPPPRSVAPQQEPDWKRQRHLGGFFRVTVGGGYLSTTPSPSGAAAFSSGAGAVSLAAGGALAEDWILAAEAWVVAAPASALGRDWTLGLSALGLNVTHYFMPANIYLSFVPSVTMVSVSDAHDETVRETQVGFGAKFSLGKEWWVGDHWGIGLALEGFFASNHEQASAQPTWTTVGGAVVFSATFN